MGVGAIGKDPELEFGVLPDPVDLRRRDSVDHIDVTRKELGEEARLGGYDAEDETCDSRPVGDEETRISLEDDFLLRSMCYRKKWAGGDDELQPVGVFPLVEGNMTPGVGGNDGAVIHVHELVRVVVGEPVAHGVFVERLDAIDRVGDISPCPAQCLGGLGLPAE